LRYDSTKRKTTKFLQIGTIMNKEYISETAWSKIINFLKNQKDIYIKSEESYKSFMEAIFWMARTGAQWRELPLKYGKWNSVFHRFNEWSKKNIWEYLFTFCQENPDLENAMMDSTIIRAHACAAGYKKQKEQGLGRSKGGFSSKIHALADALGNPLKFIITEGQRNDITQADALISGITNANVLADKGYDADHLRSLLTEQKCVAVIPPRSNRKNKYEYDEHLYEDRSSIECFFSKIKHFRRIFSRFDKSMRNYLSFLSFVGACIWLR
jgi:transposase